MSATAAAPSRFIDPAVLTRIGNLDLVARVVVDGFVSGLHRTTALGASSDFAEHRPYVPGDDVRRIDWRVWARTDRMTVKTFEAQTNADLTLAIDLSASMDYASDDTAATKLDYARMVGASLVHLGSRQRDRVGLVLFDDDLRDRIPPSGRQRERLIGAIARAPVGAGTDLPVVLRRLGNVLGRRGIVVVISDFYAPAEPLGVALGELAARGHDVIALQVLDPVERSLALDGPLVLEDAESGARLPVDPAQIRADYTRQMAEHVDALGRACAARRVDHALLDTGLPLDHALHDYLALRARAARVR